MLSHATDVRWTVYDNILGRERTEPQCEPRRGLQGAPTRHLPFELGSATQRSINHNIIERSEVGANLIRIGPAALTGLHSPRTL
jgi:hypothetical protein